MSDIVDAWIRRLGDPNEYVRSTAIAALIKIGPPAVDSLITALKNERVCYSAIRALGHISDARAVEPLINLLANTTGFVQYAAIRALGHIGNDRATGPLIRALQHIDVEARWNAAEALGHIRDAGAVEPLVNAIEDRLTGRTSWFAIQALGQIGDIRAVEPLIRALQHRAEIYRLYAARALVKSVTRVP